MDIALTLILVFFKLTIFPEISWWVIFLPLFITFIIGFIRGHYDGSKRKYQK